MPRKKKINKFEDDVVSSNVVSNYGDVVRTGSEVLNNLNSLQVIGVSPALDIALGGGLREGSCVVMTGDPKSGKTTTALHFAAKCQKIGKKIIYANTEGRLAKQNFEGIKGLDPEKILIVESTDDRILSAEDFLNIIEYYINNEPECLILLTPCLTWFREMSCKAKSELGLEMLCQDCCLCFSNE